MESEFCGPTSPSFLIPLSWLHPLIGFGDPPWTIKPSPNPLPFEKSQNGLMVPDAAIGAIDMLLC